MRIAVPPETAPGERRVALVPKAVTQLRALGAEIVVAAGAGLAAGFDDAAYQQAGAEIGPDGAVVATADVVLRVARPTVADIQAMREGAALIGVLDPRGDPAILRALMSRRITAFRMEAMPRITRAQDMDVLSSMSTISGYRAAIIGAHRLPLLFPMLMTAAGTVTPARVLVLGAGVAGLQAIATCRRLGAVVTGFDIRAAARDQVESLGARFLAEEVTEGDQQDTGGYAKELDTDSQRREQEMLARAAAASDLIIATAFVPNRPAPVLLTEAAVAGMRRGSVIVDLAAPSGGNCQLTRPGEVVTTLGGVTIVGPLNLPAEIPGQASQLYAHNLMRFLTLLIHDAALVINFDDEVISATCLTHEGELRAEDLRSLLQEAGR